MVIAEKRSPLKDHPSVKIKSKPQSPISAFYVIISLTHKGSVDT